MGKHGDTIVPFSLAEAIDDANLLVAFASQRGVIVESAHLRALTRTKHLAETSEAGLLPADDETAFWSAYQHLTDAIKPATLASIKASALNATVYRHGKRRKSPPSRAVDGFRFFALVVLVILLILQIYVLGAVKVLDGLREQREEALDVWQARTELNTSLFEAHEIRFALENPANGNDHTGNAEDIVRVQKEKISELGRERRDHDERIYFLREDLQAKKSFLQWWFAPLEYLLGLSEHGENTDARPQLETTGEAMPVSGTDGDDGVGDLPTLAALGPQVVTGGETGNQEPAPLERNPGADDDPRIPSPAPEVSSANALADLEALAALGQEGIGKTEDPTASVHGNQQKAPVGSVRELVEFSQYRIFSSEIVLKAFDSILLPLFYGLLGACAYVLRSLSKDVRDYTYTEESRIQYQLRLMLGALAGLSIAWFVNPTTAPSIANSIAPFALAFVGGYSVEIIFTAMDNLVAAFSRKSDENQTLKRPNSSVT